MHIILKRSRDRANLRLLRKTSLSILPQGQAALARLAFYGSSTPKTTLGHDVFPCRSPSSSNLFRYKVVVCLTATASSAALVWQMCPKSGASSTKNDEVSVKSVERGKIVFEEPTMLERLNYMVDDFLSTTPYPRFTFMTAMTGLLLATGSAAFYYLSGVKFSVGEAVWTAWTVIADPGTHTMIKAGQGRMRMISIIYSIGGLFFFALLIGLVNDKINEYTEGLQAADSKVLVRDHVLLLGSSSKLHSVLEEFGKDLDSSCKTYVVMADQPLDEIHLDNGARIISRTGDCSDPADLLKVSPNTARSVVLLSPECEDDNESDAMVMTRAMALLSLQVTAPIIVEIRDKDNIIVVRKMLKTNAKLTENASQIVPVCGNDVVGCLMVLGAFEPGISKVVHQLLDYEQEPEVHVQSIDVFPQLEGRKYGDAIFMFDGAIVLGVVSARTIERTGCPQTCPMMLNAPDDFVLQKGDKICAVVKNLDSFNIREEPAQYEQLDVATCSIQHHLPKQNILLCNWRDDIEDIFREIDKRVGQGSVVTVVSHYSMHERNEMLERGGGLSKLKNIQIKHVKGQTVKQSTLHKLVSEHVYDAILVFSDSVGVKQSKTGDARAAVCSLLLRSLMQEDEKVRERRALLRRDSHGNSHNQGSSQHHHCLEHYHDLIITEIKDRQSLQQLKVAGVSNWVIANELSSMMLVHMACRPELRYFWIDNIFSDHGDSIRIARVDDYIDCSNPTNLQRMTFWDLLATCRAKGATPFGYRKSSGPSKWRYNPKEKSDPLGLQADDWLLVLAPVPCPPSHSFCLMK